jgi:hypothetical protein
VHSDRFYKSRDFKSGALVRMCACAVPGCHRLSTVMSSVAQFSIPSKFPLIFFLVIKTDHVFVLPAEIGLYRTLPYSNVQRNTTCNATMSPTTFCSCVKMLLACETAIHHNQKEENGKKLISPAIREKKKRSEQGELALANGSSVRISREFFSPAYLIPH